MQNNNNKENHLIKSEKDVKYKRISKDDRVLIAHFLRRKLSYRSIAKILGVHYTTISREVSKNKDTDSVYRALSAHRKALSRMKEKQKKNRKIDNSKELKEYILDKLLNKRNPWTPEQITGRLKYEFENNKSLKFIKTKDDIPSFVCIYRWINNDDNVYQQELKQKLVFKGRKYKYRKNKALYKRKRMVDEREPVINERLRVGDFEGDTIEGRSKKQRIITLVDRKARYLKATKTQYDSFVVYQDIKRLFSNNKDRLFSFTFDNGSEFEAWSLIEKDLNCRVYFAYPSSPKQRDTNENTNRLLRRFFPKGYDFDKISNSELESVVNSLNNTPRKCLGFKTPRECYFDSG